MSSTSESFTSTIYRDKSQAHPDKQTLGLLLLHDESCKEIFSCYTLELPDKDNKKEISRIPCGDYKVVIRASKKYGPHFQVKNVKGRSFILIHAGNYFTQIRGCILVGSDVKDINGDGVLDVVSSGKTLKKLLELAPDGFDLTIIDQ